MGQAKEQIIVAINSHILKNGDDFRNWYVGISANPHDRLFNDHKVVKEQSDEWICYEAPSSLSARG